MNDLQKDQAIYQAMCEIADKYFNRAVKENEAFREFMAEKSIISLAELKKCKEWSNALYGYYDYSKQEQVKGIDFDVESIDVDTYHCEFRGDTLFSHALLEQFKSLAKNRNELYFTYEEKPKGELICSVSVGFDNLNTAKTLIDHCADDELRPVLNNVLMDVNTSAQSINFVATQGHSLAIITNKPGNWTSDCDFEHNYMVLIPKNDWKRLIDYAKKNKTDILFDVYQYDGSDNEDDPSLCTMIAKLGDAKVKFTDSIGRYPNWRSVLPDTKTMRRYEIHPDDIQALRKWQKSISKSKWVHNINVSVYAGSDRMYFDYCDYDFDQEYSASFRMKKPSPISEGIGLSLQRFRTTPFNGICIQSHDRATYIVTDDFDLLLQMPMLREDGDYVIDPEHREVHDCIEVEQTATIVDMAAA